MTAAVAAWLYRRRFVLIGLYVAVAIGVAHWRSEKSAASLVRRQVGRELVGGTLLLTPPPGSGAGARAAATRTEVTVLGFFERRFARETGSSAAFSRGTPRRRTRSCASSGP